MPVCCSAKLPVKPAIIIWIVVPSYQPCATSAQHSSPAETPGEFVAGNSTAAVSAIADAVGHRRLSRCKKLFDNGSEPCLVTRLALPHNEYPPPELIKRFLCTFVPSGICIKFRVPEFRIGGGPSASWASYMPVPEAAVDEDDLSMARQHNVGMSREVRTMQPEAIPKPVQQAAYYQFRSRIAIFHLGHDSAAIGGGEHIRHGARLPIDRRWERYRQLLSRGYLHHPGQVVCVT